MQTLKKWSITWSQLQLDQWYQLLVLTLLATGAPSGTVASFTLAEPSLGSPHATGVSIRMTGRRFSWKCSADHTRLDSSTHPIHRRVSQPTIITEPNVAWLRWSHEMRHFEATLQLKGLFSLVPDLWWKLSFWIRSELENCQICIFCPTYIKSSGISHVAFLSCWKEGNPKETK